MGGVAYGTGRGALLDAAIHIVATQGLRGMTYRSVAAEAGVTQGLVKHHFGNWDILLEEALSLAVERSLDGTELGSDEHGLDDLASRLVDFVSTNTDLQAFQFELALESRRRAEIRPVVEKIYARYREAVRRELARNGLDDEALAWAVFAALDGLVFQLTVFGAEQATRQALEALKSLLRRSVATSN